MGDGKMSSSGTDRHLTSCHTHIRSKLLSCVPTISCNQNFDLNKQFLLLLRLYDDVGGHMLIINIINLVNF